MDKKKNKDLLQEPSVAYGQSLKLSEIEFQPMHNMMESLRAQGCITFDEFANKFSKFL